MKLTIICYLNESASQSIFSQSVNQSTVSQFSYKFWWNIIHFLYCTVCIMHVIFTMFFKRNTEYKFISKWSIMKRQTVPAAVSAINRCLSITLPFGYKGLGEARIVTKCCKNCWHMETPLRIYYPLIHYVSLLMELLCMWPNFVWGMCFFLNKALLKTSASKVWRLNTFQQFQNFPIAGTVDT